MTRLSFLRETTSLTTLIDVVAKKIKEKKKKEDKAQWIFSRSIEIHGDEKISSILVYAKNIQGEMYFKRVIFEFFFYPNILNFIEMK